jgi:small subunit ribosomal protein S7
MPRTGRIPPRKIISDVMYKNELIARLINHVMKSGKKSLAQKQVYEALESIKKKENKDPLEVFEDAIKNITPQIEVRSRRVGGAAYQVPTPIRGKRGTSLAMRWLVREARKRPNNQFHRFSEKLAQEILDASRGEGMAFQRKLTAHKMADANKAFAHFRW